MSANISKERREQLLSEIKELRNVLLKEDSEGKFSTYLDNLEKEISEKKYGLVFEEHKETIDDTLEQSIPVLTERKDLFVDNGGQMNFLIEGDNLASLQLLERTHKGLIDVIYIDPPYNTGNNDFVYDDKFVDETDTFRHSKWISFVEKRLKIAHRLLNEKGIIFISIDDNEYASLKFLMDMIFDGANYIATYIKQSKVGGGSDSKFIVKEHEYCLVYAKNIARTEEMFIEHDEDYLKRYKEKDSKGRFFWDTFARPGLKNPIFYDIVAPDGTIMNYGWIHSEERYKQEVLNGDVRIVPKADGTCSVQFKQYLNTNGKKPRSMTMDFGGSIEGKNDLAELFDNKKIFSYPKSVKFVTTLLKTITDKNIRVLDFFAGSGTTGHAIMKLNAEDGGNRRFILCTNNENNICKEVTYERIKRVIEKEDYKESLKYMKVDFVNILGKLYYEYADELLKHIRELVELENGVNFKNDNKIAIILTEAELSSFLKTNEASLCKKIYLSHDVLPTIEQQEEFEKRNIELVFIPNYYYEELDK